MVRPPRRRPSGRTAAVAATAASAALLALSGCGSSPATASGSGAAQGTVVKAALTEYRITLSPTPAAPGLYTFVATNRGAAVHALEVVGPGGTQRTPDLGAGQSARFTVRLASGSTDVFCPVGTHKELGMDLELTIP